MNDEDRKINEDVYEWLSQPEAKFYMEILEESINVEKGNLETVEQDHRYFQGRLSAFKQMFNYKEFLREYLDERDG